jgi:hypothetical protein
MKPPETQHKSVQPAGARVSIMTMTRRRVLGGLAAIAALPALMPLMGRAAEPLRIGIIGAGWLGSTVGKAWVRAGHEVMLSSRHPQALTDMAKQLGPRASVGTPAQAAEFGAVLLFAVPYEALPALGRDLHASLRGKIVLDACNAPAGGKLTGTRSGRQRRWPDLCKWPQRQGRGRSAASRAYPWRDDPLIRQSGGGRQSTLCLGRLSRGRHAAVRE